MEKELKKSEIHPSLERLGFLSSKDKEMKDFHRRLCSIEERKKD